ncbi:MAG TPA: bifunctional proline dehydrogenase/L-glutamate gamma-semialdehyde dehydrogenase PutA [Magnetospirillum sp.]|nr:bifunctional proline dehydrogenase/L-glutamate gamma-semialdehyde dehydrogenase PutA [Magnetospirillum sp.]
MLIPSRNDGGAARARLSEILRQDEAMVIKPLLAGAQFPPEQAARVNEAATRLVEGARERKSAGDLDAYLREFSLSTQEGVVLMCLAEALLRIPDADTADRLIRDKVGSADWASHLGRSDSLFVNASTWALMLTGRLMRPQGEPMGVFARLLSRAGEPLVREALVQAVRIMGRQFVMGRTIGEALARARDNRHYRHSFDMLGEAAHTAEDAERYFSAYMAAIEAIGVEARNRGPVEGPGISVKLSALHPRYEYAQAERVRAELLPRLAELCRLARLVDIGLTVDAEEADRLELSLDVIAAVAADPGLKGWEGLGLAVQAYQTRARPLIAWLEDLARESGRRLMVRLVKGAYWDTEIKRAQERGLAHYPVFTRKAATDVSYLACARDLLSASHAFYPAFATHNAHTVAAILEMAGPSRDWEFQRLHGMGEALYDQLVPERCCRVYAPVGSHEDLLPYLVRRLLENGANSSFVNRLADEAVPVARIVADPVTVLASKKVWANPKVPVPPRLFEPERRNSRGWDLTDPLSLAALQQAVEQAAAQGYAAAPVIAGQEILAGLSRPLLCPADYRRQVGDVVEAGPEDVARAVNLAVDSHGAWDRRGGAERALVLDRASEALEASAPEMIALLIHEAGKTIPDAVAELREAVDYLRYYAAQARAKFAAPLALPGVTGEANIVELHGRGVFACISPWNFPLAIFVGQVAAALAAGNATVAKPAEQTPLIAARAVALLHGAGVPGGVLALLPGDGAVGQALVNAPGIAGVAFTGSTEVARGIARALAAKDGPIVPLIAETGGINAMIVDSSALPEQVVSDVIASAFGSAGQRCSALRLLFVQNEVADRILAMLAGAVRELAVGNPADLATDVGPVIDRAALQALEAHAARLDAEARLVARARLPDGTRYGTFFAPAIYELGQAAWLDREVFGPCLHVVRYDGGRLDGVLDWIGASGYGLTLGIHSRIDAFVQQIRAHAPVGNIYVNRSQIGAVVGCQPFGGEGMSGTGPKAGGPHTLYRYACERTVTINLAAAGGNAALLATGEDD